MNKYWDCKCTVEEHPDEFSIWSFINNEDKPDTNANIINFGIRTEFHEGGTHIKTLYCPLWMINKTGRILTYKVAFLLNLKYNNNFHFIIVCVFYNKIINIYVDF